MPDSYRRRLPTRFGFLLVPDFSLISMSAAIETLRMANRSAGADLYRWRTISVDGGPVRASDGLGINVDHGIADAAALEHLDAVIVCGGLDVEQHAAEPVLQWLRHAGHSGIALGATCTGSYVLAKAGLLDGYRCSIHWENLAALKEAFPAVQVGRGIYTIDRDRYTSSGGTTPIDMMLYFVRQQFGAKISSAVAEQFVYERIRDSAERQRMPLQHAVGNQSEKIVAAVELMEANIREPISQQQLAMYVGLSTRQLQRLFQKYLLCTPARFYRQMRLEHSRELLHRSTMSLVEISASTGFVSKSHFSKSFKEIYGYSPRHERRLRREESVDI